MVSLPLPEPASFDAGLAPDLELTSATGEPIRLSSLWAERPLALAFLPAPGTAACDDNASQLRDNDESIAEAGGVFAAILREAPAEAAAYAASWNLDYTLLCDPDGSVASAFGVRETQLGLVPASFVIDTAGRITHAHRAATPAEYPSVWTLVEEVEALTGKRVTRPQVALDLPDPSRSRPLLSQARTDAPAAVRSGAWSCVRCGVSQCELNDIATASGFLSRMFNLQNRRFVGVSCLNCGYTELYKRNSPAIVNIIDFLSGS